jgi:hypothetical protein
MGIRRIHKREFKMKSTYTTKKRKRLVQIEWKCCDGFSKDNLKHKLYMAHKQRNIIPLPIIYSVPFHGDYIQMSLFLKILKWESQNWDFSCFKILDVHIFLKSNLF